MKKFGTFLSNLRTSAGLSMDALATLGKTSKSTISRMESGDIPTPFRGQSRTLIIALGEVLCTSRSETDRYLQEAGIDRTLLTEIEEIQLGFTPHIPTGSSKEIADLERLEQVYKERLQHLERRQIELGIGNSPRTMKLRIQEYTNTLQEIERRLDKLHNRLEWVEPEIIQTVQPSTIAEIEGKLVVGHQYGEEFNTDPLPQTLHSLASSNARWLMQLADVDFFAIDDCILLTNSPGYTGWDANDIKTTVLSKRLPIPDDLEKLKQEKLSAIEKDYFNSSHYRLVSFTPFFTDLGRLEIILAPIGFHEYYSLTPFFDEPLLAALDGSPISIRQKYGNTALTYTSTDRGTSLIPTPVSVQCIVLTKDRRILLTRRSSSVAFYPNHWSASFEETMNAPGFDRKGKPSRSDDADFFICAIRGLHEEFAIPSSAVENIKVISLNVEYLTLSLDVITMIKVDLHAEKIIPNWQIEALDRNEATKLATISCDLETVVDKLFSRILWHPTSRMRLIQYLFHTYGVKAAKKAIEERE